MSSDYTEALEATSGKNLGKLHEELSTALGKAETFKGLADSFKRDADENQARAERLWGENRRLREQLADLQAGYAIAKQNQAEAEHRARALAYALQPIVERANESPIGAFLPVEWQLINEAQAIMGNADAGPRLVVREFARALEETLRHHDGKPDWLKDTPHGLFIDLREEVRELGEEVSLSSGQDPARIQSEARDVAAFALMIWHVAGGSQAVNRGREVAHAQAL